jgi:hypothetical protein
VIGVEIVLMGFLRDDKSLAKLFRRPLAMRTANFVKPISRMVPTIPCHFSHKNMASSYP